ncbi:terminase large subunit domain-containing protein [Brevundimonas sp. DC300-4]|uniref:phage terminase large subunit family protein n=1 Tax=Brevundimonas sp. DC300-4 TaxID=2804594 RepID=UPI003CE9BA4B
MAARLGAGGRIALVGATLHDVRAVMVEGPSGLMNLPFRTPPVMESSLRRLVFPGGAVGVMLSAAEPERLRGPQFHAAWGDEFCAWERPEEVLAMLRLGVRLKSPSTASRSPFPSPSGDGEETGWTPKLLLTTTPKPLAVLRRVLAEEGCVRTHAPTGANAENLAEGFLEAMQDLYGGTRRAAQELDGVVLEAEGALFTSVEMARARMLGRSWMLGGAREGYERAVVAVDPPVGTLSGEGGDACGIVVVARAAGTAWVLDDRSVRGLSPAGWAARVARTARDWEAALGCPVRVVAEGNQGGDMVEAVLKGAGVTQVVRRVQARVGKRARAEPVAALYEQGRVGHVGELTLLEEELLGMGEAGAGSPDRADALVWAVTDLLIDGGGVVIARARVL